VSTTQTPRIAKTRLTKLKPWAQEIGVPYTSAREAGVRGEFPIVRIGRALYVERKDGDQWIENQKQRRA
jgi:hypothetical protein